MTIFTSYISLPEGNGHINVEDYMHIMRLYNITWLLYTYDYDV